MQSSLKVHLILSTEDMRTCNFIIIIKTLKEIIRSLYLQPIKTLFIKTVRIKLSLASFLFQEILVMHQAIKRIILQDQLKMIFLKEFS